MEVINIIIVIELICVQLIGALNRYFPFGPYLSRKEKKRIWHVYLSIAAVTFLIYIIFLEQNENIILTAKKIGMIGFLPYLIASIYLIPNSFFKQIFLMGMHGMYYAIFQTLCTMVLHITNIININLGAQYILAIQLSIYIIQYILTFKYVKKIFEDLMPVNTIFESTSGYKKYLSVVPMLFVVSFVPNALKDYFLTMEELAPRILILGGFFLFYKYVITNAEDNYRAVKNESDNQILKSQLEELNNHILMMNESREKTSIMRHDFRHNLRMIYTLLESQQVEKAMELIKSLDTKIEESVYHQYSQHPIVNAALSVYISKAEMNGIEMEYKVNLPYSIGSIVEDYAVVLSNILENAVKATAMEPEGQRKIKLVVQTRGRQIITSIKNTYNKELVLKDGVPITRQDGHGIGMISLQNFAKENKATISFSQENGWVTFMMYWVLRK